MPNEVGVTHHVKIGDDFYLIRNGSYQKRAAPQHGARFSTGDPDYNNLSMWQHWVQSCWIGGMDAETWVDDAMYDEAVGIDTSQHEVAVLARDLGPNTSLRSSGGWSLGGQVADREFIVFAGNLYCMSKGTSARLFRYYTIGGEPGYWENVVSFGDSQVHGIANFSGKLWFGTTGSTVRFMNPNHTFGTIAKPAGQNAEIPRAMKVFRQRLYFGFGRKIWRLKGDETWDGSTSFYDALGIDDIISMETHLGFIYFMSANGHILRSDGTSCAELWSFDGGTRGVGLRSYDGKLFVSTSEDELGSPANHGVLYQFTGAAVTELKRWGKVGRACTPGRMRTTSRKMFYGASDLLGVAPGFGIAVYDAVEDAHSIFAANRDGINYVEGANGSNFQVDDVFEYGGYLFCSVRGHGVFKTRLTFKDMSRYQATYDTTAAGASPGSLNGGYLVSSDFDAGTPGLQKMWNAILVHCDLPTEDTSIVVEYSLDGGATWTYPGGGVGPASVTKTNPSQHRYRKVFKLPDVKGTRIKWRMTLRTTDSTRSPQLRSVTVRYLPIPEPNWQWRMTLVLSEEQLLLDGVDEAPDIEAQVVYLEDKFRRQELVYFQDIDGVGWTGTGTPGVLIYDLIKDVRYIGPSSDGALEADVTLTLIEAAEQYPV